MRKLDFLIIETLAEEEEPLEHDSNLANQCIWCITFTPGKHRRCNNEVMNKCRQTLDKENTK